MLAEQRKSEVVLGYDVITPPTSLESRFQSALSELSAAFSKFRNIWGQAPVAQFINIIRIASLKFLRGPRETKFSRSGSLARAASVHARYQSTQRNQFKF